MIPQSFIDDIQSRADIAEIIGGYIPLKRAGRNFKAVCPFHSEKTPSFVISPQKQIFHCFGCGAGGGTLQFMMLYEKVTFPEAVQMLATRLGIEVPAQSGAPDSGKQAIYDVLVQAADIYHHNLLDNNSRRQLDYLIQRGLDLETIKQFKLGFSGGQSRLMDVLRKKGVTLELLQKASLVVPGQEGFRDTFFDRVMFPICDTRSRVVGFGARLWQDRPGAPKYINSLEGPVYSKREQLFGLNFARDAVMRQDSLIIVEGYLDVIVPFSRGIKNIAASSGTALTQEQIKLIRRFTSNVVLVYDADKAGEAATLRALDLLLENEINLKIVRLPAGHDPDTLVRKEGAEKFLQLLAVGQDFFDFKLSVLCAANDAGTTAGKSTIAKEMFLSIGRIKSDIVRYDYLARLADKLAIKEESLMAEFNKSNPSRRQAVSREPVVGSDCVPLTDKVLVKFMAQSPGAFALIKGNVRPDDFVSTQARQAADYFFKNYSGSSLEAFVSSIEDHQVSGFLSDIILDDNVPLDKEAFKSSLLKVRGQHLRLEKKLLRDQIKEAERSGNSFLLKELMTKYMGPK
jgi:DNA primase